MPNILYINSKGKAVNTHSYSSGLTWKCPRRYKHLKIDGFMSRDDRSSLEFGKAIESAMQHFSQNGREPGTAILNFKQIWQHYQLDTSLVYTSADKDWENLYRVGSELMALYELTIHKLPIQNEVFQTNYKKELFPDTEYAGLQWQSFLDVISEVPWDHPLLPPLTEIPENGKRKVIIDIKTSASAYSDSNPKIYQLDGQLRQYAWGTGIADTAFLVLCKNGTKVGSGDKVTLLGYDGPPLTFDPQVGEEFIVLTKSQDSVILIQEEKIYDEYQSKVKEIKGKGSEAAKENLLTMYVLAFGFKVRPEQITKQRIQFIAARIPKEDQEEAGEQIGMEAVSIADAFQSNNFPKCPGVRFPNQVCNQCECLGLCIGDEQLVKQRLIQIGGDF